MEERFRKYWERISYLYSFGFILDPRWKLESYNEILLYVICTNINMPDRATNIIYDDAHEKFNIFYKSYEDEFRAEETQ